MPYSNEAERRGGTWFPPSFWGRGPWEKKLNRRGEKNGFPPGPRPWKKPWGGPPNQHSQSAALYGRPPRTKVFHPSSPWENSRPGKSKSPSYDGHYLGGPVIRARCLKPRKWPRAAGARRKRGRPKPHPCPFPASGPKTLGELFFLLELWPRGGLHGRVHGHQHAFDQPGVELGKKSSTLCASWGARAGLYPRTSLRVIKKYL